MERDVRKENGEAKNLVLQQKPPPPSQCIRPCLLKKITIGLQVSRDIELCVIICKCVLQWLERSNYGMYQCFVARGSRELQASGELRLGGKLTV